MRKLLILALSVISLTIMAQVPQGVGYQGVATDANGIELVNQSISIRASVLSGSATGTIEWEETHATSTDTFGLSTLTIGQGINTTNGLQTSFADISWGTNTYFLKIEMDVTGGSTYSNMGTNQMMSVPYALYAESANINYDSISNLLSNDSTFITTVGGGMGGSGCDFIYPEGLDGEVITGNVDNSSGYTVPLGKRLYLLHFANSDPVINSISFPIYGYKPIILNSSDILSSNYSTPCNFNGFLVDESPQITAITGIVDNLTNGYTVPLGKRLYLLSWNTGNPRVNNLEMTFYYYNTKPMILNPSDNLLSTASPSKFNGYLVDENYFAGCGGGSSNNSNANLSELSINLAAYNDLANQYSGLFNYSMCQNSVNNSSCIINVPTGKLMKFTNIGTHGSGSLNINGQLFMTDNTATPPEYLSEGQFENFFPNNNIPDEYYNVQYDIIDNVDNLLFNYIHSSGINNVIFSVPLGKTMKITYFRSTAYDFNLNGQYYSNSNSEFPEFFQALDDVEIIFDSSTDHVSIQYLLFDN